MAMNVLELARQILIASVNRETTGKYCTHLFLRRLLVFVFSGWGGRGFWRGLRKDVDNRTKEGIHLFSGKRNWKLGGDEILIVSYKF